MDSLTLRRSGRALGPASRFRPVPGRTARAANGPSTLRAWRVPATRPPSARQPRSGSRSRLALLPRPSSSVSPPTNAPMRSPSVWLRVSCSMARLRGRVRQGRWQARRTRISGQDGKPMSSTAGTRRRRSCESCNSQMPSSHTGSCPAPMTSCAKCKPIPMPTSVAPHRLALINAWPDWHTALCRQCCMYPCDARIIDSGTAGDPRS